MIGSNFLAYRFESLPFPYLRLSESFCGKMGTASFLFSLEKENFLQKKTELRFFCFQLRKKFFCKIESELLFSLGIPKILKITLLFNEAKFWIPFIIFLKQQNPQEKFYWFSRNFPYSPYFT